MRVSKEIRILEEYDVMGNLLDEIKQKEKLSVRESRKSGIIQAMISDADVKTDILEGDERGDKTSEKSHAQSKRGRPKVMDRKIKDKKTTLLINSDDYEEFCKIIEEDNRLNDSDTSVNDTICRLIRKYVREHKN